MGMRHLLLAWLAVTAQTKGEIDDLATPQVFELPEPTLDRCTLECENGGYCEFVAEDDATLEKEAQRGDLIQKCICTPGYSGLGCEIKVNQCAEDNLCYNGMPCTHEDGSSSYRCDCALADRVSTFAGLMCRAPFTEYCTGRYESSSSTPFCTNGGKCKSSLIAAQVAPGNFTVNVQKQHLGCMCPPDFYGSHCELLKFDPSLLPEDKQGDDAIDGEGLEDDTDTAEEPEEGDNGPKTTKDAVSELLPSVHDDNIFDRGDSASTSQPGSTNWSAPPATDPVPSKNATSPVVAVLCALIGFWLVLVVFYVVRRCRQHMQKHKEMPGGARLSNTGFADDCPRENDIERQAQKKQDMVGYDKEFCPSATADSSSLVDDDALMLTGLALPAAVMNNRLDWNQCAGQRRWWWPWNIETKTTILEPRTAHSGPAQKHHRDECLPGRQREDITRIEPRVEREHLDHQVSGFDPPSAPSLWGSQAAAHYHQRIDDQWHTTSQSAYGRSYQPHDPVLLDNRLPERFAIVDLDNASYQSGYSSLGSLISSDQESDHGISVSGLDMYRSNDDYSSRSDEFSRLWAADESRAATFIPETTII